MLFDKTQIKSNFNKSSKNYDVTATLQKQIAKNLFDLAKSEVSHSKNILDLGSGSGFIGKNILSKFPDTNIFQLDLAVKMLESGSQLEENIFNINADIDNLPFKQNSFELVISSLAFQWLSKLNNENFVATDNFSADFIENSKLEETDLSNYITFGKGYP